MQQGTIFSRSHVTQGTQLEVTQIPEDWTVIVLRCAESWDIDFVIAGLVRLHGAGRRPALLRHLHGGRERLPAAGRPPAHAASHPARDPARHRTERRGRGTRHRGRRPVPRRGRAGPAPGPARRRRAARWRRWIRTQRRIPVLGMKQSRTFLEKLRIVHILGKLYFILWNFPIFPYFFFVILLKNTQT